MVNAKPSPYTIFKKWLVDGDLNSQLDSSIEKIITPLAVISMFSNLGKLTIHINNFINSYDRMFMDKMTVLKYFKELCIDFNIEYRELEFLTIGKTKNIMGDEIDRECFLRFPWINSDEIDLVKKLNNDEYKNVISGNVITEVKKRGRKKSVK